MYHRVDDVTVKSVSYNKKPVATAAVTTTVKDMIAALVDEIEDMSCRNAASADEVYQIGLTPTVSRLLTAKKRLRQIHDFSLRKRHMDEYSITIEVTVRLPLQPGSSFADRYSYDIVLEIEFR
ncbi:MAG: hypothetical protein AB1400_02255 [Pseudomonadota bacterium]|jgi:hypothetical protein